MSWYNWTVNVPSIFDPDNNRFQLILSNAGHPEDFLAYSGEIMLESPSWVSTTETAIGTPTSNASTSSTTVEASPTSQSSKPSGEQKSLWIGLLAGTGGALLLGGIAYKIIVRCQASRSKARRQEIELTHSALPPSNTSRPPHAAT